MNLGIALKGNDIMLKINDKLSIPDEELQFRFTRSSGPGGQNVNKVNSKAILDWDIDQSPAVPDAVKRRFRARFGNRLTNEGTVQISSDRFRDQPRNVQDCLEKLRSMVLEVATPPKPRRPTKPSKKAKEQRLKEKKIHSEKKRRRQKPGL